MRYPEQKIETTSEDPQDEACELNPKPEGDAVWARGSLAKVKYAMAETPAASAVAACLRIGDPRRHFGYPFLQAGILRLRKRRKELFVSAAQEGSHPRGVLHWLPTAV